MGRGRKQGLIGLTQPRRADVKPVSGWWFPWEVEPFLLRRTEKGIAFMSRKSVYRRSTPQLDRGRAIVQAHIANKGLWCPGDKELLHRSHFLDPKDRTNFLTIDHKVPLSRGGNWNRKNLRVVCYKLNHVRNGVDMNEKPRPTKLW